MIMTAPSDPVLADLAVTFDDIVMASKRIAPVATRTPILTSDHLNSIAEGQIFIKPENLQRTGSFKFRGAYNRLSQIPPEKRLNGVVAWSSGNHAQGVAAAAQLLAMPATIVMPQDAPAIKIEKTKRYGAQIVFYDRYRESREEIGRRLAQEQHAVLVPSYDDADIIAGQGTCGLEFIEQLNEMGTALDDLLVCCGGGGLIGGTSLAFQHLSPSTRVFSVEPDQFDDHLRSLKSGKRERNREDARSICDALLAPEPGGLTFPINRQTLTAGLSVDDDEVLHAIQFAYSELKIVVEPGGAVALAALLSGKIPTQNRRTGIVVSGGNIDPDLFAQAVGHTPPK